jgi:glycerol transport system ATP-binding protein
MNFLPVETRSGLVSVGGRALGESGRTLPDGMLKLGIRPEYLRIAADDDTRGLPATVTQVQDIGTYVLVTCKAGEQMLKARLAPDAVIPSAGDSVRLQVLGSHTCFYANEELVA